MVGPVLSSQKHTIETWAREIITGHTKLIPDIFMNFVDVRDVALAHVKALD